MRKFTSHAQASNWLNSIVRKTIVGSTRAVSQQAYKDVKEYVPYDVGTMYDSGTIHSDFNRGIVSLVAPQVRRLYYGTFSAGAGNRQAIPFWWEKTKDKNYGKWKTITTKIFNINKR